MRCAAAIVRWSADGTLRRVRLLVGFLVAVCAASAMGGDAPGDAWRPHPLGASGLVLTAPATWNEQRDPEGALLVLRSPLTSGVQEGDADARERARGAVSVAVQPVTGSESTGTFMARCRRDLERFGTEVEFTAQDEVPLGGQVWARLDYTFKFGRFTMRQELYATVVNGSGCCVVFSSEQSGFANWQGDFAAIVATLGRSRPTLELK
jgi:hypothetical protein